MDNIERTMRKVTQHPREAAPVPAPRNETPEIVEIPAEMFAMHRGQHTLDEGLFLTLPDTYPYAWTKPSGNIVVVDSINCCGVVYKIQYEVPDHRPTFAASLGIPLGNPYNVQRHAKVNECKLHRSLTGDDRVLEFFAFLETAWAQARGYSKKVAVPISSTTMCVSFYATATKPVKKLAIGTHAQAGSRAPMF